MTGVAVFHIDDPEDPRIADYRNIPDPALRKGRQIFVAEGRLVVRRLLSSKRLTPRSVMVTAPAMAALTDVLDSATIATFVVPQPVMNAVTGLHIHRGCLAIGDRGAPLDWPTLTTAARRVVVLERVANADNVGSIFRNAAAFGADAVLLGPDCIDPLYRKAIRTSMAAALTIPFARMDPWPDALRSLRASGFRVLGLSPGPDACALRHVVATLAQAPVAIVAGHEGDGLTREAMDACDALARIPMAPEVDSLNVAMAVGIALYELSSK